MDDQIRKLAVNRRELQFLEEHRDKLLVELERMPLYKSYQEALVSIRFVKEGIDELTDHIKADFVEAFDGENKQPHPAVTIGEYTELEYDPDEALRYCVEHEMPTLLKLNTVAFNKAAKSGIFEFVLVTKKPRANIAGDLSEYLEDEDV